MQKVYVANIIIRRRIHEKVSQFAAGAPHGVQLRRPGRRRHRDERRLPCRDRADRAHHHGQPVGRTARFQQHFSGVTGDRKSSDEATFREFCTATSERKQRIPVHTFRRGEHVVIGEADFEVLYTCADAKEKITNFNDNSAVLMLSCKGTRVLFPGDTASVAGKVLLEAPEKLKCDVVQVSHHGFNGAPEEVCRLTGAHTALWPTPLYEMERNAGRPANAYLLKNCETVLAANGTARLCLPYVKGSCETLDRIFPDKTDPE